MTVCPAGSGGQTPVKSCTDPAVCRNVGSNQEMSSAQQQGFSGEFRDPSAIASLPGQFYWTIYTLINPTLPLFLTSAVKSQYCDHLTLPLPLADVLCPGPDDTPQMQTEMSICTLKPVHHTTLLLGPLYFYQSFITAAEPISQLGGLRGRDMLVFLPADKPYLYLEGPIYQDAIALVCLVIRARKPKVHEPESHC